MCIPTHTDLNDSRSLERTLQIVATLIAVLPLVLIMLPAANTPTTSAGEAKRLGPDRQRHYTAYTLPVTRPATKTPPVINPSPWPAQSIALPQAEAPPLPTVASAPPAEPVKDAAEVAEPPPPVIASEPATIQEVEPELPATRSDESPVSISTSTCKLISSAA